MTPFCPGKPRDGSSAKNDSNGIEETESMRKDSEMKTALIIWIGLGFSALGLSCGDGEDPVSPVENGETPPGSSNIALFADVRLDSAVRAVLDKEDGVVAIRRHFR